MYGAFDISTSGMIAQRTRLEVIAANIANQDSVLDTRGQINPYRRRTVLFAPVQPGDRTSEGMGVRVAGIALDPANPAPKEWDPDSPLAYTSGPFKGYVATTNVNTTIEQINAMEAVRAYEANVMAAEATKQMVAAGLRLLA